MNGKFLIVTIPTVEKINLKIAFMPYFGLANNNIRNEWMDFGTVIHVFSREIMLA